MADGAGSRAQGAPAETITFDWEDPLQLERGLSEEERMVRDAARACAGTLSLAC